MDEENDLYRAVGRIEQKLDQYAIQHATTLADHEIRIRTQEQSTWKHTGATTAIAFIASLVMTAVINLVRFFPHAGR